MQKHLELSEPTSCLNKVLDNEIVFVLLARDESAPVAIAAWIQDRLTSGKNKAGDAVITEAVACAKAMEASRNSIRAMKDAQLSLPIDADEMQRIATSDHDCPGIHGHAPLRIFEVSDDDVRLKAQPEVGHTAEIRTGHERGGKTETVNGRGTDTLLDPLCKCGHPMSNHYATQSTPDDDKVYLHCQRTPCGVRCNCKGYTPGYVL